MSSHSEFLQYLYHALSTPIGIELPCSDITKARAKLYAARAQAKDPTLTCLEFRASPDGKAVLIVKGKGKNE